MGPHTKSLWSAITPLVIALLWRRISEREIKGMSVASAMVGFFAVILMGEYADGSLSERIGSSLRPVCSATLLLLWCDVYRRFPLRRAIVILAFVQLISMLLDMGIKLIPTQYYAGLALLLPLISSLMLCMSLNRAPDVVASPKANFCLRSEVKQRWRFLATATLFSFIYGLNQVNIGGRWINVVAYGLSGLILLVCCFALRRRMSVHRILNIGFLVVGIGMMACMPLEIEAPSLFSILPSIGFGLSSVLFLALATDRSYRFGIPVLCSAGVVKACSSLGSFLGMNLESIGVMLPIPVFQESTMMYAVTLVAIAISAVVWAKDLSPDMNVLLAKTDACKRSTLAECDDSCPGGDGLRQRETGAKGQGNAQGGLPDSGVVDTMLAQIALRCRQIGDEYLLTARECEILNYLIMGWSIPRIEEELSISNSTAKTHVRHIYTKTGVHSRDELKALVGVDIPFGSSKSR